MGAVIFRHEVQVGFLGWIKDRFNGSPAGIGNRARWQALDPVRVIRTHGFEILASQVPIKVLDAVDDRRVALKAHAAL